MRTRGRHWWLALGWAGVMGAGLAVAIAATGANGNSLHQLGPFGPEGPRMREQLWLLPSGDPRTPLRATVFRPREDAPMPAGLSAGSGGRRPMVVINHGTSEWTRHSVSMPVYYWLSRWFIDRGYVVALPQRRGHGATGGDLIEARGSCADPDHYTSGQLAADDLASAVRYLSSQDFVAPGETIVVGVSTGGWASLALAARSFPGVRAIVNFAGGRGGHAYGERNAVCGEERLVEAAGRYGSATRIPTLWLYAGNDSYFGPDLARSMHTAWTRSGGAADLHVFASYGTDGHSLADDAAGWRLWGGVLSMFISRLEPAKPSGLPQEASAWSLVDQRRLVAEVGEILSGWWNGRRRNDQIARDQ